MLEEEKLTPSQELARRLGGAVIEQYGLDKNMIEVKESGSIIIEFWSHLKVKRRGFAQDAYNYEIRADNFYLHPKDMAVFWQIFIETTNKNLATISVHTKETLHTGFIINPNDERAVFVTTTSDVLHKLLQAVEEREKQFQSIHKP